MPTPITPTTRSGSAPCCRFGWMFCAPRRSRAARSTFEETAAKINQGIAAAACHDVDHPGDGYGGRIVLDGLLQHAIEHADGIVKHRGARGQRAPAAGLEAGGALGCGLARERVRQCARVAAEIVDREVAPVQDRAQSCRLAVD